MNDYILIAILAPIVVVIWLRWSREHETETDRARMRRAAHRAKQRQEAQP